MSSLRFTACALILMLFAGTIRADEASVADAVEARNAQAVGDLLAQKSNVNAPQVDGMTALHWAAYHDDGRLVKQLLAAGADAKAANRYGVTPLSLACTNGNEEFVKMLLAAGADSNTALPGGETALMTASRTGRIGAVGALLEHKAKVDAREHNGQTALMWAAAEGHVEVVDALLKAGADFATPLPSGFTPLLFAIREGRSKVVSRLLQAGANVNEPLRPKQTKGTAQFKSTSPLILAVENGHFELAVLLLEAGADANARPAGYTALHVITWVRKPIRGDGDPPPMGSGKLNSLEFVRSLVAHKADVNLRLEKGDSGRGRFTTTGSTPFLLAARNGDLPLMRLLLELHADSQVPNADNCPPLLAAAGVGALSDGDEAAATDEEAAEAVKLLIDNGADMNAVDKNGETAMHGAAYQSRPKVIQLLADRGADIKVWNQNNKLERTPLLIARGHRPANFRPSPETIAALEQIMRAAGVTIPDTKSDPTVPNQYSP